MLTGHSQEKILPPKITSDQAESIEKMGLGLFMEHASRSFFENGHLYALCFAAF